VQERAFKCRRRSQVQERASSAGEGLQAVKNERDPPLFTSKQLIKF
jgi:hypothetical protein